MTRILYPLTMLMLIGMFSGCASMSKKECLNADWHAIGYNEGARGIHYSHLAKHRESCGEYQIIPDDAAYQDGWQQGIRRYCTADTGYRIGSAGQAYRNICPDDVRADFLAGWRQGNSRYCTADNGLRQGLAGHAYRGICANGDRSFENYYRLGSDLRRTRASHDGIEKRLTGVERSLAGESDAKRHHKLLLELERLRHEEARSDGMLTSIEACINDDWYEPGFRDGQSGRSKRFVEIARTCRNYGIGADRRGYLEGWRQGVSQYCSYESGLYIGQFNQVYSGVCSGYAHQQFWRGYERGRGLFRANRYEAHPKPVPTQRVRQPAKRIHPAAKAAPLKHWPTPHTDKAKPAAHARPAAAQRIKPSIQKEKVRVKAPAAAKIVPLKKKSRPQEAKEKVVHTPPVQAKDKSDKVKDKAREDKFKRMDEEAGDDDQTGERLHIEPAR